MSDPWRYRCPNADCESHAVRRSTSSRRPAGKTYPANGKGASAAQTDAEARYYCPKCDQHCCVVIDAVTGAPAQPTTL